MIDRRSLAFVIVVLCAAASAPFTRSITGHQHAPPAQQRQPSTSPSFESYLLGNVLKTMSSTRGGAAAAAPAASQQPLDDEDEDIQLYDDNGSRATASSPPPLSQQIVVQTIKLSKVLSRYTWKGIIYTARNLAKGISIGYQKYRASSDSSSSLSAAAGDDATEHLSTFLDRIEALYPSNESFDRQTLRKNVILSGGLGKALSRARQEGKFLVLWTDFYDAKTSRRPSSSSDVKRKRRAGLAHSVLGVASTQQRTKRLSAASSTSSGSRKAKIKDYDVAADYLFYCVSIPHPTTASFKRPTFFGAGDDDNDNDDHQLFLKILESSGIRRRVVASSSSSLPLPILAVLSSIPLKESFQSTDKQQQSEATFTLLHTHHSSPPPTDELGLKAYLWSLGLKKRGILRQLREEAMESRYDAERRVGVEDSLEKDFRRLEEETSRVERERKTLARMKGNVPPSLEDGGKEGKGGSVTFSLRYDGSSGDAGSPSPSCGPGRIDRTFPLSYELQGGRWKERTKDLSIDTLYDFILSGTSIARDLGLRTAGGGVDNGLRWDEARRRITLSTMDGLRTFNSQEDGGTLIKDLELPRMVGLRVEVVEQHQQRLN
jgi:hypothetical protein